MKMATLSQACLIFVLLFTSGILIPMVKGYTCTEDMGGCDALCGERCRDAHPGPNTQPSCVANNVCRCNFDCKKCDFSLGIWATGCNNRDCDAQCHVQYPGKVLGPGYCNTIGGFTSCICEVQC